MNVGDDNNGDGVEGENLDEGGDGVERENVDEDGDGNDRTLFDMNGGVLDGVLDGEEENGDSFEDFLIL